MSNSTQLFVEADAKMDTYTGNDGVKRTQLNLLMRKHALSLDILPNVVDRMQETSRTFPDLRIARMPLQRPLQRKNH